MRTTKRSETIEAGDLTVTIESDGQGEPMAVQWGEHRFPAVLIERVAVLLSERRKSARWDSLVCADHGVYERDRGEYGCPACKGGARPEAHS